MKDHTLKDQYERVVGKAVIIPNGTILIRDYFKESKLASYDKRSGIIKDAYDMKIGEAVIIESHNPFYKLPTYIIRNNRGANIGVYDENTNILKDQYDRKLGYGFALQLLFDL